MGNPTELYVSLMEQLDLRRRKLRMPMWKLDDLSGVNDGYFAKALHADAASGRQAGWRMLDYLVSALYPRGVRVKLILCRKPMLSLPGVNSRTAREIERSKIVLPRQLRLYLSEQARERGRKGAAARYERMTKRQRSEAAQHAAVILEKTIRETVRTRGRGRLPRSHRAR
jgi:hypothetical protein